jgi:hypothetical protein
LIAGPLFFSCYPRATGAGILAGWASPAIPTATMSAMGSVGGLAGVWTVPPVGERPFRQRQRHGGPWSHPGRRGCRERVTGLHPGPCRAIWRSRVGVIGVWGSDPIGNPHRLGGGIGGWAAPAGAVLPLRDTGPALRACIEHGHRPAHALPWLCPPRGLEGRISCPNLNACDISLPCSL